MKGIAPAFARAAATAESPPRKTPRPAPTAVPWVRDKRYQLLIGGMIWVLLILMIVPEGFAYGELYTLGAPTSGDAISRLLWLALLAGGSLVLLWRATLARQLLRWFNPFLLAFVVLAAASVAWSIEPSVSLRRLIRLLTIVLAALAFALVGWHAQRFQNVVRPIITAVLLGSIVFGLGWPTLAIHQETTGVLAGAWHGLASHKNGLGDLACIGAIFWFHALFSRQAHALTALGGAALSLTCLLLSRSSTSLVGTIASLLFLTLLLRCPQWLRRYMPAIVALSVTALLSYSLAALNVVPGLSLLLSPIGMMTGKDMSFTGRTEIWSIVSDHVRLHPLLGTGYGAYWTGPVEGTPSYEFMLRMNFYPESAHNGYLDILNDLGALGLLILFSYLATFVVQSLHLLRSERTQGALFIALFMQQAITNLSESRWLSVLSVDFVIMTLATAALARTLLEQRLWSYLGMPRTPADMRSPMRRPAAIR